MALKVGLIGCGAIGAPVLAALDAGEVPSAACVAALVQQPRRGTEADPRLVTDAEAFFAAGPELIVECAGHEALQDAPGTGLGRENFAAAFLRHKAAESVEEVRNPHNLWLTLLVELGPLGLVGGAVLLGAVALGGLRRLHGDEPAQTGNSTIGPIRILPAIFGVLCVQALWPGTPFENGAVVVLWMVETAGVWALAFVATWWVLERFVRGVGATSWLIAGLYATLLAGLVLSLLGFALTTPAGLAMFVVAAASIFALRPHKPPTTEATRAEIASVKRRRRIVGIVGVLLVLAHLTFVTGPVLLAEKTLDYTRGKIQTGNPNAAIHAVQTYGETAIAFDPWSAATARAVSRIAVGLAGGPGLSDGERLQRLHYARDLAELALRRDPLAGATRRLLATIAAQQAASYVQSGESEKATDALREAAAQWEAAVALYPTNPRAHISAGQAWQQVWRAANDPQAASAAVEHLMAALNLDEQRPAGDVVRLRQREFEQIHASLRELHAAGFGPATTSAPASHKSD